VNSRLYIVAPCTNRKRLPVPAELQLRRVAEGDLMARARVWSGRLEEYRGARMDVGFVPKVLLKLAVKSEEAQKAVQAIIEAARTGEVGDGKIFVYPIAEVVRIRTGETNEQAL